MIDLKTDFLVIGSGIAGLNFAIRAARYGKVVLITKSTIEESNTYYAQGGLAAVFGKDDSVELHVKDTLRAGDGLSNRKIATILAKEAPKRITELKKWGTRFNLKNNKFRLSKEAVHSRARIVYSKDITGKEIEKALILKAKKNKRIKILEHHIVFQLLKSKNSCIGCSSLNNKDEQINIFAKKTIVASGGIGQLYSITTNPEVTTGDGIAMAFRIGATLEDMEFVQFHPTMLHNSSPSFLISETLRGEGGVLKNKFGRTYMHKYHRDGDLAPRDVVSRFSLVEMKKNHSKNVFLDMTAFNPEYLIKRFPHIYEECLKYKIDFTRQMIPVSPGAHYICGGIKTDEYGETNIRNLFAIGECACTQLHGADRLASNSMTEGLVFGTRLIEKLKRSVKKERLKGAVIKDVDISETRNGKISRLKQQLQSIMWSNVGIIRNKKGLSTALEKIEKIEAKVKEIKKTGINKEILEIDNMILLSKIIIISAIRRKESRGTHFIQEYHERHDNIWQKHLTIDNTNYKFKRS